MIKSSKLTLINFSQNLKNSSFLTEQQLITIQPSELITIKGDIAIFTCQIGQVQGTVDWFKDGVKLGKLY